MSKIKLIIKIKMVYYTFFEIIIVLKTLLVITNQNNVGKQTIKPYLIK